MSYILRFAALSFLVFCFFNEEIFAQGLNNLTVKGEKSILMNFHIKEISNGKNKVEFKNFEVLPYRTKEFVSFKQTSTNGVLVLLKNSAGEIISQQNITSPLSEHLEIPAQDGHIESAEIVKQEADFNVRLPYNVGAQLVEVYQVKDHRNLIFLASFVLR